MATSESVIRRMTRLADRHQAVNLAQGFTDEAPPFPMVWEAVAALLGGTDAGIDRVRRTTVGDLLSASGADGSASDVRLEEALATVCASHDKFSQYSFPFGLAELREAMADYTERWCRFRPNPESETTVVLGATEGLASVFAGVCAPGDGVIVFEPFHEMYPAQAGVFGLRPIYLTLRESDGQWRFDQDELVQAAAGARVLVLNTPHNPTGKVFTRGELQFIAEVARQHDLLVITDEIYEQITYDGHRHIPLAAEPGMRERTIIVNSISKTGSATGWRVGWVIAPEPHTAKIRAVHDTLVIQAPTPLQKAAVRLLTMPAPFFDALRTSYARKRQALVTALAEVGFRFTVPEGAYYVFADYQAVPALRGKSPMEAAVFLIESAGVAGVPGDGFYARPGSGATHMRFAFCRSLATLEEAAHRLTKLA
jgi:aminotransferase